ncbi:retrovirus-related pol polyprotein from transposon TNT 1-94 [Tanacetum coccineum]|uniref:Retrovirus-related pol polyprotein from transposon TNT 1-94 n=1 Tax=Tanacetum coccineum TaxID=301880 RepID=A0ABQ5GW35_9ASTR
MTVGVGKLVAVARFLRSEEDKTLMHNEGLEVIAEGLGTLKNMQITQALAADKFEFTGQTIPIHQVFLLAYVTGQPDVQHSHAVLSKWPIKRSKVQKLRYCTDDSTVFWAVGDESSMIAKHVAFCVQEIEMVVPFEGTSSAKEWQFFSGLHSLSGSHLSTRASSLSGSASNLQPKIGRKIYVSVVEGKELLEKDRSGKSYVKLQYGKVIEICLWCVDSGCSKHMTRNLKLHINFVWKFLGTVRFGSDHVAAILDLEVALRKNTYFVRNLDGVDLLKRNRSTNLYTINLREMTSASPICLMARATSTKSWLWHQRLSHLNFDTINELVKDNLVTCLPKFKYLKDHLCSSCAQGKGKTSPHKLKHVPNSKKRLHLLHMDLCGLIRVESINGKRYVLVIVDDYSRYTWVHFLRSKDEATEVIKTFLKKIQVLLQAPVIIVRTDNGTEFTNQVLKAYVSLNFI